MSYLVILMSLKGLGAFSAGKYSYFSAPRTAIHALSGKHFFADIHRVTDYIYCR